MGDDPSAGQGSKGDKTDNFSKKFTLMETKVTGQTVDSGL